MWKWMLIGALICIFVFHPFVMIISHLMDEPLGVHGRSILAIALKEMLLALSPKRILWNISFGIIGGVAGFFYGKAKQKNKELRNSEEKFRSVAQSAGDAVISINNKGKIVFWNTAAQKIFGYTENEIIGRPVTALMPERYKEKHTKSRFLCLMLQIIKRLCSLPFSEFLENYDCFATKDEKI